MTKNLDTYTIYARFLPAILSAMPLFVLWFFLAREVEWKNLIDFIISLKFLGTISVSVAFLYFYSQSIRITSKYFQNKYFRSNRGFPSTYFMSYADPTYSDDYKDKFRDRVKKILKLDLLYKAGEIQEPGEARKRLDECFDQIRLKVGKGKLVFQHNIWYGFFRNFIGGAIYAALFCLVNIGLGWKVLRSDTLMVISSILLIVFLGILAFRKAILVQNAEAYARQLIAEFMTTGKAFS